MYLGEAVSEHNTASSFGLSSRFGMLSNFCSIIVHTSKTYYGYCVFPLRSHILYANIIISKMCVHENTPYYGVLRKNVISLMNDGHRITTNGEI